MSGAVLLAALACSLHRERAVLEEFFAASRLRDLTALSRIALVVLEPRQAGVVDRFTIRSVGPSQRAAARLNDRLPTLSLLGAPELTIPSEEHGEVETEAVTVDALLRSPDGRTTAAVLVVRLGRAVRAGEVPGRWIVAAVEGAATARALEQP